MENNSSKVSKISEILKFLWEMKEILGTIFLASGITGFIAFYNHHIDLVWSIVGLAIVLIVFFLFREHDQITNYNREKILKDDIDQREKVLKDSIDKLRNILNEDILKGILNEDYVREYNRDNYIETSNVYRIMERISRECELLTTKLEGKKDIPDGYCDKFDFERLKGKKK